MPTKKTASKSKVIKKSTVSTNTLVLFFIFLVVSIFSFKYINTMKELETNTDKIIDQLTVIPEAKSVTKAVNKLK